MGQISPPQFGRQRGDRALADGGQQRRAGVLRLGATQQCHDLAPHLFDPSSQGGSICEKQFPADVSPFSNSDCHRFFLVRRLLFSIQTPISPSDSNATSTNGASALTPPSGAPSVDTIVCIKLGEIPTMYRCVGVALERLSAGNDLEPNILGMHYLATICSFPG